MAKRVNLWLRDGGTRKLAVCRRGTMRVEASEVRGQNARSKGCTVSSFGDELRISMTAPLPDRRSSKTFACLRSPSVDLDEGLC